jgi:pSer/pThr/pTyr-binding forkhead associated (FHA) protein
VTDYCMYDAPSKTDYSCPRSRRASGGDFGNLSIGRATDNPVRIEDDGVARYHIAIEKLPDGFWLSDLGSEQGTTVNGSSISAKWRLNDGDLVGLGHRSTVKFQTSAAHAKVTPTESARTPVSVLPRHDDSHSLRRFKNHLFRALEASNHYRRRRRAERRCYRGSLLVLMLGPVKVAVTQALGHSPIRLSASPDHQRFGREPDCPRVTY